MREEVDFTENNTRLSIDAGGSGKAGATSREFPFSIRLQPTDNVQNGLLDSFHGKTLGLAFVLRTEMKRQSMFKSSLDDAIEIIVEADPTRMKESSSSSSSLAKVAGRRACFVTNCADATASSMTSSANTAPQNIVRCQGYIDSDVFEAGAAITGGMEIMLQRAQATTGVSPSSPSSSSNVDSKDLAKKKAGSSVNTMPSPASPDEAIGSRSDDGGVFEEKEVSVKMCVIVLETIYNNSAVAAAAGGSAGSGAPSSGHVRSEDEHPACEIIVADRIAVSTRNRSVNVPLYLLLPRLYTCPSFAVDNICSVGFEVEIHVTVHHAVTGHSSFGDGADDKSDKVRSTNCFTNHLCVCLFVCLFVCLCVCVCVTYTTLLVRMHVVFSLQ